MTDDSHHGKGEHDERDMAVPTMPGACLIVIETEFVLGGFEAVLNGPAMDDRRELFRGVPLGHRVEKKARSLSAILRRSKKTPRPFSREGAVVFAGIEIGQFEIGPVMQAWPFGSLP